MEHITIKSFLISVGIAILVGSSIGYVCTWDNYTGWFVTNLVMIFATIWVGLIIACTALFMIFGLYLNIRAQCEPRKSDYNSKEEYEAAKARHLVFMQTYFPYPEDKWYHK